MEKSHSPLACLSKADIFKNLPIKTREELVPISTHQEYFPKGSLIRQPNDGKDGMLIIDEGQAKIYHLNEDGKEVVLGTLGQGDLDGQENLFSDQQRDNFIQATTDVKVCSVMRNDFRKLLQENPKIAINIIDDFGKRLINAEQNTIHRNSMTAKDRIMAYLEDLAQEQQNNTVTIKLKKKDLANLLGIVPETFSRKLKALEKEGKIKVNGKKIELLS